MKYCVDCKHFRSDKWVCLFMVIALTALISSVIIVGWPMLIISIPVAFFCYYLYNDGIKYGKCANHVYKDEDVDKYDLLSKRFVKSSAKERMYYATIERNAFGKCGPDALNFVPKK